MKRNCSPFRVYLWQNFWCIKFRLLFFFIQRSYIVSIIEMVVTVALLLQSPLNEIVNVRTVRPYRNNIDIDSLILVDPSKFIDGVHFTILRYDPIRQTHQK